MPNLKSGNFSEGGGMIGPMEYEMGWLTPPLLVPPPTLRNVPSFRKARIP